MTDPAPHTPATSESASPSPHPEFRLSCQSCRERKQRCDRQTPECRRCVLLGVKCIYPTARRPHKGGRRQRAGPKVISFPQVNGNEATDSSPFSHNKDNPTASNTALVTARDIYTRSKNLPTILPAPFSHGDSNEGAEVERPSTRPYHQNRPQPSPILGNDSYHNVTRADLVSADDMRTLTTLYFENSHAASPMLHPGRYWSRLTEPAASRPPSFLQNVIMATGASTNPTFAHLKSLLYKRARRLAELDEMGDEPANKVTVAHAQCWLLIANIEAQDALFSRAFISLGKSVRYAQMLRLHQLDRGKPEPSLFSQYQPPQDLTELEECRRTWWVICHSDCLTAATSGLPAAIDFGQIYTFLPVSDESFEHEREEPATTIQEALQPHSPLRSSLATRILAAYAFSQASALNSQANGYPNPARNSANGEYWSKQREIENGLLSLIVRLPPCLQLPQSSACHQAIFVNIMIHTAIMVLHKTAIQQARGQEGFEAEYHRRESRSRMLAAAAQVLAVFRLTEDIMAVVKNPIQDYSAYIAAVVFLEDVVTEGNVQSKNNLSFLLKVLRTVGQHHAVGSMLAAQLTAQLEGLDIQLSS